MLMGLRSPLKLGERVKLILIFSDGSRMTIEAPVRRE
jgi:copper(I)-binding protein